LVNNNANNLKIRYEGQIKSDLNCVHLRKITQQKFEKSQKNEKKHIKQRMQKNHKKNIKITKNHDYTV
jgi:hypothetical protein